MPAETPALTATVKYNPHLWGPAELRAIFVVRTRELDDLLRLLRGSAAGAMPQHLLVTGARGMGKTTLLRRLALAVEDDGDLATRWVPVTFPEEQYTVSTLAELWRNVLDALADTRERQGAPAAELEQLDQEIARIGDLPAAEREAAALASLDAWVETSRQRLLLLIDSTDLLLANLAGTAEPGTAKGAKADPNTPIDGGATPLWRLRKTLSHDPAIFWLGASYQSLESNHAYQDAFWDFFQLIELRPLTVAEMRAAMLALARTFGAGRGLTGEAAVQEMARNLDTRPERLKALRAITGGNPRTTVMLYELFAAGGADDVHSDLQRLLDTMTPLYKARMETLSDQARKLLAHLLEHWAPISARGLGEVSGIATNTVSGQLTRLEAEGLVEKARLPGTKRTGYQAAERLFNVWYLMRYASRRLRQRLTWLVEFMRLWFSGEEMTQLAHSRAAEHARGRLCSGDQLEYSRALGLALPDGHAERYRLDWEVFGAARRIADRTRAALGDLFELDGEDREYTTAEDYLRRFEALDALLAGCPHLTDKTRQAWIEAVKGSLSLTIAEKEAIAQGAAGLEAAAYRGRQATLEDEWRRWTERYGEAAAAAVRQATLAGRFFPDFPDPKLAYNQTIGCFGEDGKALRLVIDLLGPRQPSEWLERLCRYAIALNPQESRFQHRLGTQIDNDPSRVGEAECAYRRAIELDPQDAWPWDNLGLMLAGQAGRTHEAEAAYRRAIELEPGDAWPWYNLGNLLADQAGRASDAEAAYRRAIELDATDDSAWNNLGSLLANQADRIGEAEFVCRRAVDLDPCDPYPAGNLARVLAALGRRQEAAAAYRQTAALAEAAETLTAKPDVPETNRGFGYADLLAQSHLRLGNRDLARQALDRLAEAAAAGDRDAFSRLKEQTGECHGIGLGPALKDLMTESSWADFLQPFALALGAAAAADPADALAGAPPELRTLAEEILAKLRPPASTAVERR